MTKNTDIELIIRDCMHGYISKKQAAITLNISRMTLYRKIGKYVTTRALSHGLCGRPSNHKSSTRKDMILDLMRDKYFDCGPTLASEFLWDFDAIRVNPETLRLWMHENRLMIKTRKRKPYRQRRPRKPCFNDMLQIDGSFHEWFGGVETCVMNLIDDATGVDLFRFDVEETIESACLLLWDWCKKYGVPRSIYSDGRNMYMPDNETLNHFTMMCKNLGIRMIRAYSAQAKGRVERCNGTHQDRLTPFLRLMGADGIEKANSLIDEYIERYYAKFTVLAKDPTEDYKRLPKQENIDDYCYIENTRKVSNDWVVSYLGSKYQLKPQSIYCPTKSTVFVREYLYGKISIFYRDKIIPYVTL